MHGRHVGEGILCRAHAEGAMTVAKRIDRARVHVPDHDAARANACCRIAQGRSRHLGFALIGEQHRKINMRLDQRDGAEMPRHLAIERDLRRIRWRISRTKKLNFCRGATGRQNG